MDIDVAAREIINDLFTAVNQERAQRLVLTIDAPEPRDLGGWSEAAMLWRIKKILAVHVGKDAN